VTDTIYLACPTCGHSLQVHTGDHHAGCCFCGGDCVVNRNGRIVTLAPVELALQALQESGERAAAEQAIKKLNAEIRNLKVLLGELSSEGSPLQTVRMIGYVVITVGLLLTMLYGLQNQTVVPMAAAGIVLAIALHGSTEFIGKDYYIQKAFLNELIEKKRSEILRYQQRLA
jgi:hypothetical protein